MMGFKVIPPVPGRSVTASGPSTFTPIFSDAFLRADEDPMSTNGWSDNRQISAHFFLAGNVVFANDTTSNAHEVNNASLAANHYAQVDVTVSGSTANTGLGVQICGTVGADTDKYLILVNQTQVTLTKYIGGTFNVITPRAVTWVNGDTLRAAIFNGSLYLYQNGVQLGAAIPDASLSSGLGGLSSLGSYTSGSLDNFVCGNVT